MIRSLAWLTMSVVLCVGSFAEAQQDYSNETYRVDFTPWADRKIAIRDENGNWIGYSKSQAPFQILVDGNAYRAATTEQGIDIGKLLSNMSPRRGTDGHLYLTLALQQDVKLDDDSTLGATASDVNGQPKKREILIDVDDFYVTRSLQPSDSKTYEENAPLPQVAARERFNTTLAQEGVTPETRPAPAKEADRAHEDTIVQTRPDEDEDDVPETGEQFVTPGNALGMDVYGQPFSTNRIFSSPVCSCLGGTCGLSSGYGPRRSFRTKNGRRGSRFHQGLDINTAARRSGTPVVAAADGYLKIPMKRGRRSPKCGDKVNPADLFERGYGYTVRMTHGNGIESQYSHLKSIAPSIRWCARIKRGERIGSMGETGNSTGPHLHFGVAVNRRMVNPMSYMIGSNGRGLVSGGFLSQKCSDQKEYPEIDADMREALRGGERRQAPGVRTATRTRAAR